jgi:trehalose-6-phosphate synthase
MSDLIIVSNRGPFSFSEDFLKEAERCIREGLRPKTEGFGEGGLVQAMAGLLRPGRWSTTWIGSSMGDRDIDVARGHYTRLFKTMIKEKYAPDHFPHIEIEPGNRLHIRYREYDFYMRFVFFDTRHMHSYYGKFANGFLWPLMHLSRSPLFYKQSRVFPRPFFVKNDFVQYMSSGATFANTIIDEIRKSKEYQNKEDDIVVWSQDYHLMQVAEVVKALLLEEGVSKEDRKRIHIGQFMHTPFFNIHEIQGLIREDRRNRVKAPIYDPFGESIESVLQKVTWGMLANDFIGFHTKEYCDNYLEALQEWFPVDIRVVGQYYKITHPDGITTVGAFPIGLDVDKILSQVSREKTLNYQLGGEDLYGKIVDEKKKGKYIFGGLERRDYTKGLIERLAIFSHVLNELNSIQKDACFYQVTAQSRTENQDYQRLDSVLEAEFAKMNRKFQGKGIIHINRGIPPPQNYRFMKELDVMLVTPFEDGMNLVAFEFILSQKFKDGQNRGMLVLSTSGASRVLRERGFGEEDGIIYINPMNAKNAGKKVVEALRKGFHLSDKLINYVEKERRVEDWAKRNIDAIVNCRKDK